MGVRTSPLRFLRAPFGARHVHPRVLLLCAALLAAATAPTLGAREITATHAAPGGFSGFDFIASEQASSADQQVTRARAVLALAGIHNATFITVNEVRCAYTTWSKHAPL